MRKNLTTSQFIKQAILVHKNTYDYSKVNYIKKKDKVIITCKIHGDFLQTPDVHYCGAGCPKCKADKSRTKINDFIKRSNLVHNNKYNYSKFEYVRTDQKSIIVCNIHGNFTQTSNSHLSGKGCPKCGIETHSGAYSSVFKHNPNFELYIYFIKCYNDNESFYKIGLSKNIRARLWDIPYQKQIISFKKGKICDLYLLEQKIRRLVINDKYVPKINFNGKTECFKIEGDIDKLYSIYPILHDLHD